MSRTWLLFLSCFFILLALIAPSRASLTIRVDESAARVLFAEKLTRVSLAIENPFNASVAANVTIELLDTDGQIRGKAAHGQLLKRGANVVVIPIEVRLTEKGAADTRELLWYRLRYQVEPSAGAQFDQIKGVVSLSGISPDIFAIQVASSEKAQEGAVFRLRVRAAHPLTTQPVAGVTIEAEITFSSDPDDIVLKRSGQTDSRGFATLDFQIPRGLEDEEGDIEVTARRGILIATAESEVDLNRQAQILVSTDKPLYQPGQTLHMRVLLFDATRHALANKSVTLKLRDPESTTAFRTEVSTSRFGVASADWNIPENARLGDYLVEVIFEDDKSDNAYGGTTVRVSRYDLPNFTVNIKPDRPYYLPGQDAQVEVRADYLFGQPVKRGQVRVVRETERSWNYREQKYETKEGDKYEGELDADGSFVARIKLADEHESLKSEDYSRYRDLSYAAYFTDATTNRTEQRRFDLRLTKNAIHVYVVNRSLRQAHNFPLEFYVSTSYADGSPAPCDVAISQMRNDHPPTEQSLQTIKTNRYGLAKVNRLTLPKQDEDEEEVSLMFRARDSHSAAGQHTETLRFERDQPVIRVETDKSLYRDGEPIRAQVMASEADLTVAVDAINEDKVLQSQLVRLQNGRAEITLPYRQNFIGAITVAAYVMAPQDGDDVAQGSRTVLYPHDRDLKFKLDLSQESYRPGEEASASFVTRLASGRAAESALGIVIFDKAVEERARTDREFGGGYGFYAAYSYLSGANENLAGVSRKDLERLDLTKPLPDGLDLVAEVILTNHTFQPQLSQSTFDRNASGVFANFNKEEIYILRDRLETEYKENCVYPTDLTSLRHFSALAGINIDEWRDPWEIPYRASFFAEGSSHVFSLASAGADKEFDTDDDFTVLRINRPYFRFTGEAINRAVNGFHARTGQFIRDAGALTSELRREGIELDTLRDPWGQPYQISFGVNQTKFLVYAQSSGPDRQFTSSNSDDVLLWTSSIDYSRDLQVKIDSVLTNHFQATSRIPQDETEFQAALKRSNANGDELRDPWGRPYYVTFKQSAIYGNRVNIFSYATYGEKQKEKTELTPVTQQMNYVYLRSNGEDGETGTADDFNVVTFSRLIEQQAGNERDPQVEPRPIVLPGSTGAITGTVTDPGGAVVAGASVSARNNRTSMEFSTTTNDDGVYLIRNLPAGIYEVRFEALGFQKTVVAEVPVRSSNVTRLDAGLSPAGVSEVVEVTAAASGLLDMSTSRSTTGAFILDGVNLVTKSGTGGQQLSTPRLREYFPETLVWQPSLETDKHGRAQLNFKLADNITTWKMSVIGSTEDGQIGTVEKEFKAFQPFFVEHDPPRILTEGDEISLPVVVRNYLDRPQPISLEIKPENWFTLLGPAAKRSEVLAGDASRQTFDFRATASVKDGKQRITAIGADANDAIEKPVTVHPDGEEKSVTASDIVSGSGTVTLEIPQSVIANSMRAELKIYPNLLAHVAESVEAIMARPYGCGEQTISSTYPSLLYLKHSKRMGAAANAGSSDLSAKARRYLRAGYERLLNYRDESGGFTYWGRGEPDLALTAYALRFLNESREFTMVDDDVIREATAWLIKQQRSDGSWAAYDYGKKIENKRRSALLTAYVTRVLMSARADGTSNKPATDTLKSVPPELTRALDYLAARIEEIDEPYLIASFALAALDAGDAGRAEKATAKLRALSHEENGGIYWSLETNTPFYGWGLAGRIETTALAVQALARANGPPENARLMRAGLLFMLKQKDRYGVWYSTQATINVLDSLLVLLTRDDVAAHGVNTAEIFANGRSVKSVDLPPPNQLVGPVLVDLSQFIQAGSNRIEVRRAQASSPASVQAVATYYLPWSESVATQNANWRANGSSGLRLLTKFDKTEGKVSDEISCHVEAERIGFSGYGMLLAEIGLPPGADVDRASLDQAMKGSDWSIGQYDILPDRVIVYLWPRAGGTKFDFKFKPRFGLNAQTAASIVYDYYNPEARAIVAPARFVVK